MSKNTNGVSEICPFYRYQPSKRVITCEGFGEFHVRFVFPSNAAQYEWRRTVCDSYDYKRRCIYARALAIWNEQD